MSSSTGDLILPAKNVKKQECICPKCGLIHLKTIKWGWTGGSYLPRYYCDPCKNLVPSREVAIEEHRVLNYPSPHKEKG